VEVDIPHPRTAANQFQTDQQALDRDALERIQNWMEAAWNDDLDERCETHLGNAIQLSNEFPSLLSPWRVIWHCASFSEARTEAMRRWIVALLEHAERHGYTAARYPELAIEVHNLSDALAFTSLQGWNLMDAQYETIQNQQQLRIISLVWHPDSSSEYLLYFNPSSTQRVYRQALAAQQSCRQQLARCLLNDVEITSYNSAVGYAQALNEFSETPVDAVQRLYDQHDVSILSGLKAVEWMLDYPELISNRGEILPEIVEVLVSQDSAQAKLIKALMLNTGWIANEAPQDNGTQANETQPNDTQVDQAQINTSEQLLGAAESEMSAHEFAWRQAYFQNRLQAGNEQRYKTELKAAANADSAHAMMLWALMQDQTLKKLEWLVRAAHHDERDAIVLLAEHFEAEQAQGGQENTRQEAHEKALYWQQKAAELGHQASITARLQQTLNPPQREQLLALGLLTGNAEALAQESRRELNATANTLLPTQQQRLLSQLEAAALQQNATAMLLRYQHSARLGSGVLHRIHATEMLKQAAQLGEPEALYLLAQAYEHGHGVPKNLNRAILTYHKAAEAHHPQAQLRMAQLWQQGERLTPNIDKAAKWYLAAARALEAMGETSNAAEAWYALAQLHEQHQPEDDSAEQALSYYQQAADLQHPEAWQDIARFHDQGRAQLKPDAQASLAALAKNFKLNEASRQRRQRLRKTGLDEYDFNRQQLEQLSTEFEHNIQQGEIAPPTQYALIDRIVALIQPLRHHGDMEQLYGEWLNRGADFGHPQLSLERALQSSKDATQLDQQSCQDFKQAQALNDFALMASLLCELVLNPNSRGQDYLALYQTLSTQLGSEAIYLYPDLSAHYYAEDDIATRTQMAAQGFSAFQAFAKENHKGLYPKAAHSLAFAYEQSNDEGLISDMVQLYRVAANSGAVFSQNNLGRFLLRTESDHSNERGGWDWLQLAILQDNAAALDSLGEVFEHGWAGEIDWSQALDYYLQAAAKSPQDNHSLQQAIRLLEQGGHGLTADPQHAAQLQQQANTIEQQQAPKSNVEAEMQQYLESLPAETRNALRQRCQQESSPQECFSNLPKYFESDSPK
jgi:TPR repeat protein